MQPTGTVHCINLVTSFCLVGLLFPLVVLFSSASSSRLLNSKHNKDSNKMSKNHPPQPNPLPPNTTPFHSMTHHYKKDISPVSSLISIKVKSRTPFAAILSNISKNKPQKNQTLYSSLFTNHTQ